MEFQTNIFPIGLFTNLEIRIIHKSAVNSSSVLKLKKKTFSTTNILFRKKSTRANLIKEKKLNLTSQFNGTRNCKITLAHT